MNNSDAPATKGDLQQLGGELRSEFRGNIQELGTQLRSEMQDLGTQLRGEMQELGTQLRAEMRQMYGDVVERITDTETKLLNAFYTFAQSNQARVTSNEREAASLKERVAIPENRIAEVEKRLNMPPAA